MHAELGYEMRVEHISEEAFWTGYALYLVR
jgi:hypothetical protein